MNTGGHIIIGSTADSADARIRDVVKKHIGVSRPNGYSIRRDLLNLNVFYDSKTSYRLVEMGYVTNNKDIDKFIDNKDAIAKALIEAITGETIVIASVPKPEKPKPTPPKPAKPAPSKPSVPSKGKWIAEKGKFHVGVPAKTSLPDVKVNSLPLTVDATGKGAKIADIGKSSVIAYNAFMNDGKFLWIRQPRGKGYGYMATGNVKNGKRSDYWGKFTD